MADGRRRPLRSNGPWRTRRRATGCLLWIVGLIIFLVILSLLFGGFQKGTKADGAGLPAPVTVRAAK
jgi:hypothetical protein